MATKKKTEEEGNLSSDHYQEVEVRFRMEDGKRVYDRVRIIRPVVKITDEQANTLNKGVLENHNNTVASLYLKPE